MPSFTIEGRLTDEWRYWSVLLSWLLSFFIQCKLQILRFGSLCELTITVSLLHNCQIVQEIWNCSQLDICIYEAFGWKLERELFIEAVLLLHYKSILLDSFSVRSCFWKSDLWMKLWFCLYGARSGFKDLSQELCLSLSLCTTHVNVYVIEPGNVGQTGVEVCSTQNLN